MALTAVTDSSFDADVLKSDTPVLLDFWAEWCSPCKRIAPMLDELSAEMGDQIAIKKLNVDENRGVATQYGIRGIPTMILFKNGEVVGQKVGASSKTDIQSWVTSLL